MERHLRLVKPAGPKGPRKPQRPPPLWSAEESSRLRAALKNARVLFGTWGCLGAALYLNPKHVQSVAVGRKPLAETLVFRLARALGKPVESLCRPPSDASTCPHCGRGKP